MLGKRDVIQMESSEIKFSKRGHWKQNSNSVSVQAEMYKNIWKDYLSKKTNLKDYRIQDSFKYHPTDRKNVIIQRII